MRFAAGPPHLWRVTLNSGAEIELWADGHPTEPVDGHWIFDVLVDATPDEQHEVRISGQTVPPSDRCCMVIARIPAADVQSIAGGWSLTDDRRTQQHLETPTPMPPGQPAR